MSVAYNSSLFPKWELIICDYGNSRASPPRQGKNSLNTVILDSPGPLLALSVEEKEITEIIQDFSSYSVSHYLDALNFLK